MDTSFFLRMANKVTMEVVTETKFGAEMEGKTSRDCPTRDPYHKQPPNPDTIAYASKILPTGP